METDLRLVSSRRQFLTGTAKVAGGTALAFAIANSPLFGTQIAKASSSATVSGDIAILNYALTLERLEKAFYVQGQNRFTMGDFTDASFLRGVGGRIKKTVYDYFNIIRDHEVTHVNTLVSVITGLGGTPVGACSYNFGYTDVNGYVAVAQALENTGVMAYDGAINLIGSPDLQKAGATIATVEARHASYLNLLNGTVPFPQAFDTPKTMTEILAIAGQFIVSCP